MSNLKINADIANEPREEIVDTGLAVGLTENGFHVYLDDTDRQLTFETIYDYIDDYGRLKDGHTFSAPTTEVAQFNALEAICEKFESFNDDVRADDGLRGLSLEDYANELLDDEESQFMWRSGQSEWENVRRGILSGETKFLHNFLYDTSLEYPSRAADIREDLNDYENKYLNPEQEITLPYDLDKFYVDRESEEIKWVYYNPDSDAGGEIIQNIFSFDELREAFKITESSPLELIMESCKQYFIAKDDPMFKYEARDFLENPCDFTNKDENFQYELRAVCLKIGDVLNFQAEIDDKTEMHNAVVTRLSPPGEEYAESVRNSSFEVGLYDVRDRAFVIKSGVMWCENTVEFAKTTKFEYIGNVDELRRQDREQNAALYSALEAHREISLQSGDIPRGESIAAAKAAGFANFRLKWFDEDVGEDVDRGYVLIADSRKHLDVPLLNYGELGELGAEILALDLKQDGFLTEEFSLRIHISANDIAALKKIEPRKSVLNFTAEELASTKAFAEALTADIDKKSPYFRAENGEWRDSDENTVPIIEVEDRKSDFKSVRTDIKSQNITRGEVENLDTGWKIAVSRNGLEDTVKYGFKHNDTVIYNALYYVKDIVENGVLLDTVTSENNKSSKAFNSEFMHKFYGAFRFKGECYLAKLAVEEFPDAKLDPMRRLYNLQDIKIEPLRHIGFENNSLSRSILNGSDISIAHLFQIVKGVDRDFYINKADFLKDVENIPQKRGISHNANAVLSVKRGEKEIVMSNSKAPMITVSSQTGANNVFDVTSVGFDTKKQYTVAEFNQALKKANEMWQESWNGLSYPSIIAIVTVENLHNAPCSYRINLTDADYNSIQDIVELSPTPMRASISTEKALDILNRADVGMREQGSSKRNKIENIPQKWDISNNTNAVPTAAKANGQKGSNIMGSTKLECTSMKLNPDSNSRFIATASVAINDEFVLTKLKLAEGKNGLYLAMPQRKFGNEYQDVIIPKSKKVYDQLFNVVKEAYGGLQKSGLSEMKSDKKDPPENSVSKIKVSLFEPSRTTSPIPRKSRARPRFLSRTRIRRRSIK